MPESSPPRRRRRRRGRGRGGQRPAAPAVRKPQIVLEPIDLPEVLSSAPLAFYCKECRQEVETELKDKKMVCRTCGLMKVAYGTQVSVNNHFRLSTHHHA